MTLTQVQFDMLQDNGSFNGMSISASKSGSSFIIKMSEAEWTIFQSNQANVSTTKQSGGGGGMQLQVTMDASASNK